MNLLVVVVVVVGYGIVKKLNGVEKKTVFFSFIFQVYVVFDDKIFWDMAESTTVASTTTPRPNYGAATTTTPDTDANEVKQNARMLWIISYAAIAPLFTIPSHIIFILAAWLTDPPQASSIALVAIGILLYFFFLFRQCYTSNKDFKTECCCWSLFLPLYPILAIIKYVGKIIYKPILICCCSCSMCKKIQSCAISCCKKIWDSDLCALGKCIWSLLIVFRGEDLEEGTEEELSDLMEETHEKKTLKIENKILQHQSILHCF